MKAFVYLALLGMLAVETQAIKIKYDEAEGPTKADKGENDDQVLHASSLDHNKGVKWTNPLHWHDDGTDDDKVLTQSDGSLIVLKSTKDEKTGDDKKKKDGKKEFITDVHDVKHNEEYDKYFNPNVYRAPIEDIFNTHHGNLPNHTPASHNDTQPSEEDTKFHFAQNILTPRYEHFHI